METIEEYRHVVDEKTKKVFEISLKKIIKKTDLKNIGFIGLIGSSKKEYSHDIDVLIFPSEQAKIGEAIISTIKLYKKLNLILKKHHARFFISCSPKKAMQEMVYYLASLEEGGAGLIPVHSLFFPDYKSFKKFNPRDFQKEIKKNLITLYGDFGVIRKLKNIPQIKLEPYFLILDFEIGSKLNTFPKHLIRSSSESLFHYLHQKYKLNINKREIHNIKNIDKELFRILKELDSKTYQS